MNMQRFGQGSVGLGYFFIVAALVSGIAGLLALILKPMEFRFEQSRTALRTYYRNNNREFGNTKIRMMDLVRHSRFPKLLWEKHIYPRVRELDRHFWIRVQKPGPRFRDAITMILKDRWQQASKSRLEVASTEMSDASIDQEQGMADEHDNSSGHHIVLEL